MKISLKGSDWTETDKNVQLELIISKIIECESTGVLYKLYLSLQDQSWMHKKRKIKDKSMVSRSMSTRFPQPAGAELFICLYNFSISPNQMYSTSR